MYYQLCPKAIINVLAITTLQKIQVHTRERVLNPLIIKIPSPLSVHLGVPQAAEVHRPLHLDVHLEAGRLQFKGGQEGPLIPTSQRKERVTPPPRRRRHFPQ